MISLEFDLTESHNRLDVHCMEDVGITVLVAHNGYSYTRIALKLDEIKKLHEKLHNQIEQHEIHEFYLKTKNVNNETESTQLDSTN